MLIRKEGMENGRLALERLGKAWESTCRIVLDGEVCPMQELEKYLTRYAEPCHMEKSAISGKPVVVFGDYPKGAKFLLDEEMPQYASAAAKAKLDINSIKDIDSAVSALSEINLYAGNIVLGNSGFVSQSTRVVDSTNIYRSSDVIYSKNIAYTRIGKYSESVFGCVSAGKGTKFSIACAETYETSRHFECYYAYTSSDVHYSANIENCQECLFCFNLRGKRRCIGNLELPADKYQGLKAKLLSEARQMLREKHSVPSIYEIIAGR